MTLIPTDLSASRIPDAVRDPNREIAASSRVLDLSVGIVVCIPCFRRPQHLRLTLESLVRQRTPRSFAVVMIENDANGRESAPVAAEFLASGKLRASASSRNGRVIARRSTPRSRRPRRCSLPRPAS